MWSVKEKMGEVRVKVKLVNTIDEELVNRGLLNPNQLRVYETEALVDTGATRTVIPIKVLQILGSKIRGQQTAKYADGRQEVIALTEPIIFRAERWETSEEALVAGDEVIIGQTVLEDLNLLVDCKGRCLIPNPTDS